MDICYNIKAALKDKFYGVPTVLGATRGQDARAVASMSCGMTHTRASNGHHYWYLFLKDVTSRDVVRFMLRRNGFMPEFHMSRYYGALQPAFRMRMATIVKYQDLEDFAKMVEHSYKEDMYRDDSVLRYVDTIQTKLNESRTKIK